MHATGTRFAFAGTPPVAARARALGFFERVFSGDEANDTVLAYLKGQIIRHHFGLPTMRDTLTGVARIAKAGVLDVISLGIDLESTESGASGFGRLNVVTSDMEEALSGADIIMVVVPSSAHAEIAAVTAPFLHDGQIIVLHPGRTCGAIEFDKMLRDRNCVARVIISEAETFIYASRSDGPAQARIFRIKEAVPLAALPALRTQEVLDALKPAYPQYIVGVNVLHTGLNNMGAIFHPALTLLNAGRIESTNGDPLASFNAR